MRAIHIQVSVGEFTFVIREVRNSKVGSSRCVVFVNFACCGGSE